MDPGGGESAESGRYVLGHAPHELQRLQTQARLIDPHTRQFFVDAGVEPGMRVLDVLPTEVHERPTVLVAHGQFCVWGHVGEHTGPSA